MPKKRLIALTVLAGIIFVLTYPQVFVMRGSAGGTLYWNANEALLFVGGGISGAHMSYSRYALEPFLVSMGDVRPPDDNRCGQAIVIRITDKEIQGNNTDVGCVAAYDMFEGHIYAVYLPKLWQWVGTHFEPATVGEREFQAGRATSMPGSHPWEFDNIDGWSMRILGQTPPQYQLVLNGQPLTIIFHGQTWPPAPVSIDLIRPEQPEQTIWSFDGRPHRISKAEYERVFAPR
jgi:hypothetical protein